MLVCVVQLEAMRVGIDGCRCTVNGWLMINEKIVRRTVVIRVDCPGSRDIGAKTKAYIQVEFRWVKNDRKR